MQLSYLNGGGYANAAVTLNMPIFNGRENNALQAQVVAQRNAREAELEAARAKAMLAMSELDSLYADARTAGRDTAPIEAARQNVMAMIASEDEVLASLRGRLER